jgi:hypothetical protein
MSTVKISGWNRAKAYLGTTYNWEPDRAQRVLEIARSISPAPKASPTDAGIVTTIWDGTDFVIEDRHR